MQRRLSFEMSLQSGAIFLMPHIISMNFEIDAPVGIISDSHGEAAHLSKAIHLLKDKKCRKIIHLGDICDTVHIHTADECISLIQEFNVIAVKGNNDNALVLHHNSGINPTTIDYIQSLPLVIQSQQLIFAHSLPFFKTLGLSCMIQGLNSHFLKLCFDYLDENAILFRGHSHQPEIVVQSNHKYQRTALNLPVEKNLKHLCPCIVTCGAVLNGQCMIYYPENRILIGCIID